MIKHNQDGAVSGLLISLILTVSLLLGAVSFGFWAYSQEQDYKNHSDVKVAAAVEIAKRAESTAKTKEFLEKEKNPLKTYVGPEAYGSVVLQFPKTWSGYVNIGTTGQSLLDAYFSPGVVPGVALTTSVFALRVQVVQTPYAQVLSQFKALQAQGVGPSGKKITINAYSVPKLRNVIGVQVLGQLNGNQQNPKNIDMIVLPLRAQTLEIWTEGDQYIADFNSIILPNFSFSP